MRISMDGDFLFRMFEFSYYNSFITRSGLYYEFRQGFLSKQQSDFGTLADL